MKQAVKKASSRLLSLALTLLLLAQPMLDVASAADTADAGAADTSVTVSEDATDEELDSTTTITVTPDVPEDTYKPDADDSQDADVPAAGDASSPAEPDQSDMAGDKAENTGDAAMPDQDADAAEDDPQDDTDADLSKVITAFAYPEQLWYAESYDLDEIYKLLPESVVVALADNTTDILDATWTLDERDAKAFAADPTDPDLMLEYRMELPEGYKLSDELDTAMMPDVLVTFSRLRGETSNASSSNGVSTYAGSVTISTNESQTNLILNSSGTFGTRYEHRFDDDNCICYCIAQGKANPNGRMTYYYSGDASAKIAAVLDMGYPHYTTINGVSLTAAEARQATQFAVWCFTNDKNKNSVTVSGMRARTNSSSGTKAYNAGVWLVNYANSHSSTGIYHIWSPDSSDYQAVVSSTNSYVAPQTGTLYVQKHSNTSSIPTTGSYSLSGAVYAIYSDYACTNKLGELKTGSDGKSSGMTVNAGTYYAKEVRAPDNYALHTEVYGATVSAGGSGTINAWDQPITGTITVQKSSSNTGVSNGNSNYSLSGAVYNVYNSSGTLVKTLTTDANGKASCSGMVVGNYTIQESKAPAGYKLNSTTYSVSVNENYTVSQTNNGFEIAFTYKKSGYLYGRITSSKIGNYASYKFPTWVDTQSNIVWYDGYNAGNGTTYHFDTYIGRHTESTNGKSLYIHCYGYSGANATGTATFLAGIGATLNWSNPSVSVSTTDEPYQGYVKVNKSSGNTSITNGNSYYSLKGAVYGVYSDYACTTWKATLTTDANGQATSSALPLGTYYVKETTAPPGYYLDSTVRSVTVSTSNLTATLNVSDSPIVGYIQLNKSSANPSVTNGNSYYSLKGAVYGVYSDYACTTWKATLTTDANGKATSTALSPGTYYVKETTAPPGYKLDQTVRTVSITTSNLTATLNVTDEPNGGWLEIQKSSSMPDITDGNSCYTLQGAVYGVYSDAGCKTELTCLTTNANGYVKSDVIRAGAVYIKEITAPTGYELDETVYSANITGGGTVKLNVTDDPGNDPIGIQLTKIQKYPNQYIPSLEGAQFTIRYYAGQYATTADLANVTPTRTWVIETQKTQLSNGNVIYQTMLADKYKVSGDAFYHDIDGNVTVPIGTISVQETKAPDGYTLSGGFLSDTTGNTITDENGVILLNITQDNLGSDVSISAGNYYTQQEEFQYCSLTLNKRDSGGNPMAGATFKLQILNPDTNEYDDLTTGTTDANGQLKFSDLVFGKYRIIETSTANGASLMADPIEVTLPVTTEQDAGGTAPTYTIDGTNYYCDVTFTIQNGVIVVPGTGGLGKLPMVFAGLATLGLAAVAYVTFRRKKTR